MRDSRMTGMGMDKRPRAGDSFSQAVAALMSELPGASELHGLDMDLSVDEERAARTAGVDLLEKILCC